MNKHSKEDIFIFVLIVIGFIIAIIGAEQEREKCAARGGVLVKGQLSAYECVERR